MFFRTGQCLTRNFLSGISIFCACLLLAPLASAGEPSKGEHEEAMRLENAWLREAPPVAKVNAAYFTLCNATTTDTVLTGVSSPSFGKVEMHETIEENGSSRMQALKSVHLSAGECTAFEPGGRHLMLFNARESVRAGDTVLLRFEFTHSPALEASVPVKRGNDSNGHHHH